MVDLKLIGVWQVNILVLHGTDWSIPAMNLAHLDILIIASHIDIVTQNGNASIDAGLQLQIKINQEIYKLINLYNSPSDS